MTAGLRPLSSQWWLLVETWHWCPGHAESSFNRTEQTSPWAPMCFHRGQAQRGFPSAGPAPTLSTDVCVYHPPHTHPLEAHTSGLQAQAGHSRGGGQLTVDAGMCPRE